MEIRLSTPDEGFALTIADAAQRANCHALIKRASAGQVRFELREAPLAPRNASIAQHDDVIARLFMADPHAVIRTAKAVYDGAADFEAQRKARVA